MEYEFSDKAIKAAIEAIRDIDETASRGIWRWDQTFEGRQDRIVQIFMRSLPTVTADDVLNDAFIGGRIKHCLGKAYAHDVVMREYLAPFFRSLEPLVNKMEVAA